MLIALLALVLLGLSCTSSAVALGGVMSGRVEQDRASLSTGPRDRTHGQWVEVRGQWLGGTWVPAHRAWVSLDPAQ